MGLTGALLVDMSVISNVSFTPNKLFDTKIPVK